MDKLRMNQKLISSYGEFDSILYFIGPFIAWFLKVGFAKKKKKFFFQGIIHFPKGLSQLFFKSLSSEGLVCAVIFVAFLAFHC